MLRKTTQDIDAAGSGHPKVFSEKFIPIYFAHHGTSLGLGSAYCLLRESCASLTKAVSRCGRAEPLTTMIKTSANRIVLEVCRREVLPIIILGDTPALSARRRVCQRNVENYAFDKPKLRCHYGFPECKAFVAF